MQTALRELHEETCINPEQVTVNPTFYYTETYYPRYRRMGNQKVEKTLCIFLGEVPNTVCVSVSEHQGYEWVTWNPPHQIQQQTIDPLLAAVDAFFKREQRDQDMMERIEKEKEEDKERAEKEKRERAIREKRERKEEAIKQHQQQQQTEGTEEKENEETEEKDENEDNEDNEEDENENEEDENENNEEDNEVEEDGDNEEENEERVKTRRGQVMPSAVRARRVKKKRQALVGAGYSLLDKGPNGK